MNRPDRGPTQQRTIPASHPPARKPKRWYHRLGPGLITACVVIGPGSILTSSRTGATYGYSMNWVVVVAVAFMMAYTTISARLGVVTSQTTGELVAQRAGRWLAALIGIAVFFIASAFQFGNNLGVHSAIQPFWPSTIPLLLFNALTIGFLFSFRNLYRAIERLMMILVAIMLVSFALNLAFARPDPIAWAKGFVPSIDRRPDLALLGLVGTTFVVAAAYYQSYLVKQKGWTLEDVEDSLRDARVGAIIMAVITLMIMATAGSVLRGHELRTVADVAAQLEPLFGRGGQAIFCLGLFAAAYSSFLVNSLIGGYLLADGLGLATRQDALPAKVLTAAVLLSGMFVALYVLHTDTSPVAAIVAAQAITVIASPLMAFVLLWLANSPSVVGQHRPGLLVNVTALLGFLVVLLIAWHVAADRVWPQLKQLLQ